MHVKKFIWFLILCLAVLSLFVLAIDYPLIKKIQTVSHGHLANQDVLARFYRRGELAEFLEEDYLENKEDLDKLGDVFLNQDKTVDFITGLEKIARQTGNIFEIKSASEIDNGRTYLNFHISVLGDFNGFIKFLAGLESSPYLIEIEDISIKKLTSSDFIKKANFNLQEGDLESILSIKIYTE